VRTDLSKLRTDRYPLRRCLSLHECAVCGKDIVLGQRYYDGGYNRRVHETCDAVIVADAIARQDLEIE